MSAIFTWSVENCIRETGTGGIVEAIWRCNANETADSVAFISTCSGVQRFFPSPGSADFITYENVIESDVLNWLWADSVDAAEIERSLQAAINDQKEPERLEGLPWIS